MTVATIEEVEAIVAERVAELERRLDPRAYTVRQVAERLGLSVTRVRELIRAGELRSYQIGGARRVDPADLSTFIGDRRRRPETRAAERAVRPSSDTFSPEFLGQLYAR